MDLVDQTELQVGYLSRQIGHFLNFGYLVELISFLEYEKVLMGSCLLFSFKSVDIFNTEEVHKESASFEFINFDTGIEESFQEVHSLLY